MSDTTAFEVDPSNLEQRKAWDGDEGEYWAAHAATFDRAVATYHQRLLETAAIGPADRVLDIGCGNGQTTRDAAREAARGHVVGVDLSTPMLEVARERAAADRLTNVTFLKADAQVHPFGPGAFDLVISRTGVMFFGDRAAGFNNLARALRPRGRLVIAVWQDIDRNEWFREIMTALAAGRDLAPPPADAPGPFALSDPERVRALLTSSGFEEPRFHDVRAPMWFGEDAGSAHQFLVGLTGWMLERLDDTGRTRALDTLRETLRAHQTAQGVELGSAMWLIEAERTPS